MKKSLKKLVAMTVCSLMVGTALTGCGTKTSTSGSSTSTSAPVTLTYSIWDTNQEPGMKAMADAFTKKNPNIKIKVEVTPWDQYWTKLEAAGTGGALPDVFWMHTNNFDKYSSANMLLDLTDKIKASGDVKLSNFPTPLVDLFVNTGKNYGLPKDYDTVGLWYNKDLFDKAKIAYPDSTWDWAKFLDAAQKLTDKSKGIYGYTANLDTQQGYYDFVYQNNGTILSDDKKTSGYSLPATKEAIQFYVDLSLKYKVSPTQAQFDGGMNGGDMLKSGKVAMGTYGSWMVADFKAAAQKDTSLHLGLAALPKGKTNATIYNGLGNVVAHNSKNAEQAWKFVEYMGTQEANVIQANSGAAIPAFKDVDKGWTAATKEFDLSAYPAMLPISHIFAYSKSKPTWEPLETKYLKEAFYGKTTVSDACDKLAKDMNAALATEK